MNTKIIKLDKNNIDMDKLRFAADVIKQGGLVAFPTETVYGLGANALNESAAAKIFEAKGRPSDNPLIVHIAEKHALNSLVSDIPPNSTILMDRFWPGPLTLIMNKSKIVPPIITAGLNTVAIRMPSHPVALALIREAGLPIAAPSANLSGKPSPTNAAHVINDLSGRVDVIIDAGDANIGLESTVLDTTINPAMILRPGGITPEQLKAALGDITFDPALLSKNTGDFKPRAPGMKYQHYSPKADVVIVQGELSRVVERICSLIPEYQVQGKRVGVLATDQTSRLYPPVEVISAGDRGAPETIAASLFRILREFDDRSVEIILAEAVDNSGIGLAVMNRMVKAAGYNIIRAD